jgi:hypothetical protein
MMFAANGHQTVLLLMLLALPTTVIAQAPTLPSQVPGPAETSSITTIEGGAESEHQRAAREGTWEARQLM